MASLFASLFKKDGIGRRKLTTADVVNRLDKYELTEAQCTLIRDVGGNDLMEDYGQVEIFRVQDEFVYSTENGFFITSPTDLSKRNKPENEKQID